METTNLLEHKCVNGYKMRICFKSNQLSKLNFRSNTIFRTHKTFMKSRLYLIHTCTALPNEIVPSQFHMGRETIECLQSFSVLCS